jgi:hypothetical protein
MCSRTNCGRDIACVHREIALHTKRSFALPGLPERVELHINRLGPVGEHVELAKRFIARRQAANFNEYTFQIPAPEDRVIAGTLQRMYRNLYIRICDVFNTASLIERQMLDFVDLREAAEEAGIWPGVATFLTLAADYVKKYRGDGLELPDSVIESSHFGADSTLVRGGISGFPHCPRVWDSMSANCGTRRKAETSRARRV